MSYYEVAASAIIDSSPEQVYAIISDYHQGHAAMLPPAFFTDMEVNQ